MFKNIFMAFLVLVSLTLLSGCERQQKGANTVFNKETASDFTTEPPPKKMPAPPPMLPGKAQTLGAPIRDTETKTTTVEVQPSKDLSKPLAK